MHLHLKSKIFHSTLLATLLIVSGCSDSDGTSSSGDTAAVTPSSQASGPVVDGYIAGGHLYADIDGSGDENSGDINTTTDAQGNFTFGTIEIPHGTYLYVTGGTDLATNTPFTGELSAYFDGNTTVISPLSTVIAALTKNEDLPYEEAITRSASMMGLTEEQVVSDPFAEPIDTKVFIATQRIVTVANTLGGDFSTTVDALASSDMNITAAAETLSVDPTEALAVDTYLTDLEEVMPTDVTPDDLSAYQTVLSEAVSDPTTIPAADATVAVADALGCVTFDAIKGTNTSEENITTDLLLGSCERADDNVTFVWSSDNAAILDNNGMLMRPIYTGGAVDLSLTVTSDTDTTVSAQKHFSLTVPRLDNHAPVAVADSKVTNEDTPVSLDLLANDSDEDGDALTLVAVSSGVDFSADGTVNYTPAEDFNGDFSFTYTVRDSWGDETNSSVTVTVNAVNDAPVLGAIADQTLNEDFLSQTLTVTASDVENDALTYSVISVDPAIVNASFNGNQLDLSSIADLNGDTNIVVMVSDGDKNDTKQFTLHLLPVDDAPVISAITAPAPVDEDSAAVHVTYNASDVDSSGLSIDVTSSDTTIATAVIVGSDIVITPQPEQSGTVTITLSVSDGVNLPVTQSFDLTINAVDDAPVLRPVADVTMAEDGTSGTITLSATDIDNDPTAIIYGVADFNSSLITASITGADLTVTGVSNAFGETDMNISATSNGLSVYQTVHVTVTPVDDAPVLTALPNITVAEDNGTITVSPSATDIDSDETLITYSFTSSDPSIVTGGSALATVTDANGVVTITVTALSNGLTDTTDFNITVTAVNDAPTAEDFTVPVVTGSTGVTIDLNTHIDDVDNDTLNITSIDPLAGLTQVGATSFSFDSNGTEGSFALNYTVADPDGLEATATMTINVSTTPIYPQANPLSVTTQEEVAVSIDLLTPNLDAVSVVSATSARGSVVIENNGTITFTPEVDFNGLTVISYTVESATADQNSSTVDVNVTDVNDAPVITYITAVPLSLTESVTDYVTRIDLNITDVDTDLSSVSITNVVSTNPDVLVSTGTDYVELTVPAYVNGEANITVTANDGQADGVSSFQVSITAVDSPAVIGLTDVNIDVNTASQNYPLDIQPLDESYTLSLTNTGDANVAWVSLSGSELVVEPQGRGDTIVTVEAVNDANTTMVTSSDILIHVYDPSNVAPVSSDAEVSVVVDQAVTMTLLGTDSNGDMLTYSIVSGPSNGTLTAVTDWGEVTYIASGGYMGDVSFSYKVSDGDLDSNVSTVLVHVTASPDIDDSSDVLTQTEFDALGSVTFPDTVMYGVEEHGWDGMSQLDIWNILVDHTAMALSYMSLTSSENGILPFTYDTDNNTLLLDYPDDNNQTDGIAEEKLRLVSVLTDSALNTELNLTLPTGVVGYKVASLMLIDEYNIWTDGDPQYQDWNCSVPDQPCVGSNPYLDLQSFMTDRSYDPNTTWGNSIWIGGYEFKFAQDSNLSAGVDVASGVIVRTAHYWDPLTNQDVQVVTNSNAGTWEYISSSAGDVIKVSPSVYGVTKVRLYAMASADGTNYYVYEGEYNPAGQGKLQYWYDENTMYHIGNSIMNRTVVIPENDYQDASGEFTSFNTLADEPMLLDSWMHAIWAYDDNGVYGINVHSLKFDSDTNQTLEIRDTRDGDNNATYTLTGNVATIDGAGIDAKLIETITDATRLSEDLNISVDVFATYHTGYRFAHVEANASLDLWYDELVGADGTTKYSSYSAFETAFINHEVALDYTPNNTMIVYASGTSGVGGTLAELDQNTFAVVNANAGTWSVELYNGEQIMLISVSVDRYGDNNAIALDGNGFMSRADYSAPDSGSIEYRFDDNTANAIISYLEDQNLTYGNPIQFEIETPIMRDIEVVAFTADKMNSVWLDVNQSTCERSVTRQYIWMNGDAASGSFVISTDPQNYTYTSSDGAVATVNNGTTDVFMVKVNEELNASQLMAETNLFLPPTAHGYKTTYMDLLTNNGGTEIRLDDATVGYLESYYNNNHMLDAMCSVPAP